MTQAGARDAIEVHVGTYSPIEWDKVEAQQREAGQDASDLLLDQRRPVWADPEVRWEQAGLRPRWVGEESAGCAAALDPNQFSSYGLVEFERFAESAARRREVAVTVAFYDLVTDSGRRNIFGPVGATVPLIGFPGSVAVGHLGRGVVPALVAPLEPFDKDLATRLLNSGLELRWGSLRLVGQTSHRLDDTTPVHPGGRLEPLIVSGLDEPVAAVWVSPGGDQRVYVLPLGTPPDLVLRWLGERALPALLPTLMRRAHDPDDLARTYPTGAEVDVQQRVGQLEEEYLARRRELEELQREQRRRADPIRWALLYGSGSDLEDAVACVCRDAGLGVVELDEALGSTSSADLLVRSGGRSRLVEVKSSSKAPSETTYEALVSHLRRWPAMEREPVEGGVLVINHQIRTEPGQRPGRPFTRAEFLTAAEHPILTTTDLLDAWRRSDFLAVQEMFFPPQHEPVRTPDVTAQAAVVSDPGQAPRRQSSPGGRKGGWPRRGRSPQP